MPDVIDAARIATGGTVTNQRMRKAIVKDATRITADSAADDLNFWQTPMRTATSGAMNGIADVIADHAVCYHRSCIANKIGVVIDRIVA